MPEPLAVIQESYCDSLRHAANTPDPFSQQPPHVLTMTNPASDYSKADLLSAGFDEKMVLQFLREPYCVQHAMDMLGSFAPPLLKGRKRKYQSLRLREGVRYHNWVVFDPAKHPLDLQKSMLPLVLKYAVYTPGNAKLLEYNTITRSIRIRAAKVVLKGKTIVYTQNGPLLEALKDESAPDPLPVKAQQTVIHKTSVKIEEACKLKQAVINKTAIKTEDDGDSDLTEIGSEDDKRAEGT